MPLPGEEIRAARRARGWSQEDLARHAGVSPKTIWRIENNADYVDPSRLPVVRATLGLDDSNHDLSSIPVEELAGELVRRVIAAQRVLDQTRLGQRDVPPEVADRADTLRGPRVTHKGHDADQV